MQIFWAIKSGSMAGHLLGVVYKEVIHARALCEPLNCCPPGVFVRPECSRSTTSS